MADSLLDQASGLFDEGLTATKSLLSDGFDLAKDALDTFSNTSSGKHDTYAGHVQNILKNGLARTNRFQVIIPLPQKIVEDTQEEAKKSSELSKWFGEAVKIVKIFTGKGTADFTRGLDIMLVQTSLPGKMFNISETKYNGDTHKSAHSIIYGQHQFTFKVSRDMYEKAIIDNWMNIIVDPNTHEVGYHRTYAVDIIINQLDESDKIVKSIMLEDAWPVNVNELTLSNLEFNNTHELMVQFAYRKWKDVDLDTSGNGLIDKLSQTPLGPYLTPILSNPAVQKGLEFLQENTGIDLEGEAVNIYNQVDKIVKETTGDSINSSVTLLNGMMANLHLTEGISDVQLSKLMDLISGTVNKIKE